MQLKFLLHILCCSCPRTSRTARLTRNYPGSAREVLPKPETRHASGRQWWRHLRPLGKNHMRKWRNESLRRKNWRSALGPRRRWHKLRMLAQWPAMGQFLHVRSGRSLHLRHRVRKSRQTPAFPQNELRHLEPKRRSVRRLPQRETRR